MAFPLIMTTGLCNRSGAPLRLQLFVYVCWIADICWFIIKALFIKLSGFSSSSIESKLRISSAEGVGQIISQCEFNTYGSHDA